MFVDLMKKVLVKAVMDIDQTTYIGQLPGVHLRHLKNSDPGADHQKGKDNRYDCPRGSL